MRHAKVVKRITAPDRMYNSALVAKFINNIMIDGKKSIAEKKFYNALELLKKDGKDPLETFEQALQAVGPKVEVKARRVGGANYQVPQDVRPDRRVALAIRWIIEAARKRPNSAYRTFEEKLAAEINDALQNLGEAVKKRDNMQRQADANKAFGHFRF